MKKIVCSVIVLAVLTVAIAVSSCNVTRVVSNESKYYQKGDTVVTITTKTTESYDATKKNQ